MTKKTLIDLLIHNSFTRLNDITNIWVFEDNMIKFDHPFEIIRNIPCYGQFTYDQYTNHQEELKFLDPLIINASLKKDNYKSISVALDIFLPYVHQVNITLGELIGEIDPMDILYHKMWVTNLLPIDFDMNEQISMSNVFSHIGLFVTTKDVIGILKEIGYLSRGKNISILNRSLITYTLMYNSTMVEFSIHRFSPEQYSIICEGSVFSDLNSFFQFIVDLSKSF
jgi:hypothetical protein